jgi:hypothetical protein
MGELAAAFLIGCAVTAAMLGMVIVFGYVPERLWRLMRLLVPVGRRRDFDTLTELARDATQQCGFDCYTHRQEELARAVGDKIDLLKQSYSEGEIVVAVHPWEISLINSMAQVSDGRWYGRFEIVQWDVPECDAITRRDKRYVRRHAPRRKPNGTTA